MTKLLRKFKGGITLFVFGLLAFGNISFSNAQESFPEPSYYVTFEQCGVDGPIVTKCRTYGSESCDISSQEPC